VFNGAMKMEESAQLTAKMADLVLKNEVKLKKIELFGGAMSILLPESFEDISNVREVPDHQEVFVDRLSEISCIVEVLDQDDAIPDGVAVATYYFNDLASCNEASNVVVLANEVLPGNQYTPKLPESCPRCGIIGKQTCPKFNRTNESEVDVVNIIMVIARLKQVSTDLLITINIPSEHTTVSLIPNSTDKNINFSNLVTNPVGVKALVNVIDIVNSIEIHDWSLFA